MPATGRSTTACASVAVSEVHTLPICWGHVQSASVMAAMTRVMRASATTLTRAVACASPRPSAFPARIAAAAPIPTAKFQVNTATLIATECAASVSAPKRPMSTSMMEKAATSICWCSPTGRPSRTSPASDAHHRSFARANASRVANVRSCSRPRRATTSGMIQEHATVAHALPIGPSAGIPSVGTPKMSAAFSGIFRRFASKTPARIGRTRSCTWSEIRSTIKTSVGRTASAWSSA
mmetsp:Transcript_25897/g.85223  ORF Transcript_25897/g.85223 Transcript_25897/m.85223 type:complete len:237 (+) Transcript_25897:401-1111(+)